METVFSRINILMLMEKVSVPKKIWPKFSRTLLFRSVWKEHKIMSNMTSIMLSHEIKEKSCTHNAQKDSFFYSQRDFFSFCYQLLYGSSYLFFLFCNHAFLCICTSKQYVFAFATKKWRKKVFDRKTYRSSFSVLNFGNCSI